MGDLSQPVSEPVPSFTQKSDKVGGRGEKAEGSTLSTDQALGITVISSPSQTPLLWFKTGPRSGNVPRRGQAGGPAETRVLAGRPAGRGLGCDVPAHLPGPVYLLSGKMARWLLKEEGTSHQPTSATPSFQ